MNFASGIKHPQLIGTRNCHDDALLALLEHPAFGLECCFVRPTINIAFTKQVRFLRDYCEPRLPFPTLSTIEVKHAR